MVPGQFPRVSTSRAKSHYKPRSVSVIGGIFWHLPDLEKGCTPIDYAYFEREPARAVNVIDLNILQRVSVEYAELDTSSQHDNGPP
jgi:hypothetical protein